MAIQLSRGIPEPLIFIHEAANVGETWVLTRIQDLAGTIVGQNAGGTALVYPVTLTAVPNVSAWISEPLQLPASGKYLAVFTNNANKTKIEAVEVAFASTASSSSSSDSEGDAYATASDMIARFGATELAQLSDRSPELLVSAESLTVAAAGGDLSGYSSEIQDATAAALEVIQSALGDASTEINTYLSGRYTLPLTTIPPHLRRYCCDVARYYLEGARAREETEKRYEKAVAYLKDVSKGMGNLDPQSTGEQAAADVQLLATARERVFTSSTLRDFLS